MKKIKLKTFYYILILVLICCLIGCAENQVQDEKNIKYNFKVEDLNNIILNTFEESYYKDDKVVIELQKLAGFESGLLINGEELEVDNSPITNTLKIEFLMPDNDVIIQSTIDKDTNYSNVNKDGKCKLTVSSESSKLNFAKDELNYFIPGEMIKFNALKEAIEEDLIILEDGHYICNYNRKLSDDKKLLEFSYIMPDHDVTIAVVDRPSLELFDVYPELETLYNGVDVTKVKFEFLDDSIENSDFNKVYYSLDSIIIDKANLHHVPFFELVPLDNTINVNDTYFISYYTLDEEYTIQIFNDNDGFNYVKIDDLYYTFTMTRDDFVSDLDYVYQFNKILNDIDILDYNDDSIKTKFNNLYNIEFIIDSSEISVGTSPIYKIKNDSLASEIIIYSDDLFSYNNKMYKIVGDVNFNVLFN